MKEIKPPPPPETLPRISTTRDMKDSFFCKDLPPDDLKTVLKEVKKTVVTLWICTVLFSLVCLKLYYYMGGKP